MTRSLFEESGAVISECGKYRYRLTRTWDAGVVPLCWIMLNPSTADAEIDDPTIRRCMAFARQWGKGGIWVVNLFAFRSPSPSAMKAASDPVGPMNDEHIMAGAAAGQGEVVAAWGVHGSHLNRDVAVLSILRTCGVKVLHLGATKDLHPRHPLYVPSETPLTPYARAT